MFLIFHCPLWRFLTAFVKDIIKDHLFSKRILKVLIISYFYTEIWDLELCKNFLKEIASLTARNFSKDNLLCHNISESKYLWCYFKNFQNSFFFSFLRFSNAAAFKRPSFHCQNFFSGPAKSKPKIFKILILKWQE